jgi:hypothetical protein
MPMSDAEALADKLRKIEALFAGAATQGERDAAEAASGRIRARLDRTTRTEPEIEHKLSVSDPWARQLLLALCRRYGLRPYRYPRMHRQTLLVRAPRSFVETLLWPEFQQLNAALGAYLAEITARVIRDSVHADLAEPEERAEPKRIG